MSKPTAQAAAAALKKYSDKARAKSNAWFFKTGDGEYGYGDVFWGITMPQTRLVAKQFLDLPLPHVVKLIKDPVHEVRMLGAIILTEQYKRAASAAERTKIFTLYIKNATRFNNWDLVDCSAPYIVGGELYNRGSWQLLKTLARSKNLWERRIAMVSTLYFITHGQSKPTYEIATLLLADTHDLIHKATGWMLREVGKRCSETELKTFLRAQYKNLPRTTLRYAIERFAPAEKQLFLRLPLTK
jgi:3-methyladenine DNA glycosylase AlkD